MRRRVATCLSAALLALAVLAPVSPAAAAPDVVVIAAESLEGGEAPGPDPKGADASDNPYAPAEYEANFTALLFGRALFGLVMVAAVLLGIGYWLRVGRFSREERPS